MRRFFCTNANDFSAKVFPLSYYSFSGISSVEFFYTSTDFSGYFTYSLGRALGFFLSTVVVPLNLRAVTLRSPPIISYKL